MHIWLPFDGNDAFSSLALVMATVSLTLPIIPDMVKFRRRGLAYAWLGLVFAIALGVVLFLIRLEVHTVVEIKWIYVVTGLIGVVIDLVMCRKINDNFKNKLKSRNLVFR